ncbi:hypothetical protein D3C87_2085030 [compost metagenome]
MGKLRSDAKFGGASLDIGEPLLHDRINLLIVARHRIIDPAHARGIDHVEPQWF